MGRKQSGNQKMEYMTTLRLDQDMINILDAEIESIQKSTSIVVTRSQVLRSWLAEMAERRAAKK